MTQSVFELSQLNSTYGFRVDGLREGDFLGRSVAILQNFTIQGNAQFVSGAFLASVEGEAQVGQAYVFSDSGTLTIDGANLGDWFGYSVSSLRIKNEEFSYLAMTAPIANNALVTNSGAAYIIFGQESFAQNTFPSIESLDGSNGFKLIGEGFDAYTGAGGVKSIGDCNNDGFDDFVIGSHFPAMEEPGRIHIVFGKENYPSSISLGNMLPQDGLEVRGVTNDGLFGWSFTNGDFNNDGRVDLAVSEFANDKVYVLFGGITQPFKNTDLSSLNQGDGSIISRNIENVNFGYALEKADINKDGVDDIIISSPLANSGAGQVHILLGRNNFPTLLNIDNDVFLQNSIVVNSGDASSRFGFSLSFDYSFLAVGAPMASHEAENTGKIVLINTDFVNGNSFNITDNPDGVFFINGENAQDRLGWSVDIKHNNSTSHLLAGAVRANQDTGSMYILHSKEIAQELFAAVTTTPTTTETTTPTTTLTSTPTTTVTTTPDGGCVPLSQAYKTFIIGDVEMYGTIKMNILGEYGLEIREFQVISAYHATNPCDIENPLIIGGDSESSGLYLSASATESGFVGVPADFDPEGFCIRDNVGVLQEVDSMPDGFGC